MTDNEIRQILKDVLVLTNSMDKEHLTALFQILTKDIQETLFSVPALRKNI